MKHSDFEKLTENTFSICAQKLMGSKRAEYGAGENRLAQFVRSAQRQKTYPEAALIGMMDKHVDSVYEFVADLRDPLTQPWSLEMWTEKITDLINYLVLLRGLLYDRYGVEVERE